MTLIREINNEWFLKHSASFDAPLRKGLCILVDSKILQMVDSEAEKRTGDMSCRLIEWQYRIKDAEHADLELIVEEVHPTLLALLFSLLSRPFARLSQDTWVPATMVAAMITSVLLLGIGWTVYLNQEWAWAFAGRHVRFVGGLTLFLLFSWLVPKQLGLFKGRVSFGKIFFQTAFFLTGVALMGVWLRIASLPEHFTGSDQEFAAYSQALFVKFSVSYWPLLLAALPWMAAGFKVFGFDLAVKTTDAVAEAAKAK